MIARSEYRLKPAAWASCTLGGSASSSFSVTTSTSAGPSWAKAAVKAPSSASERVTRSPRKPISRLIAAKSAERSATLAST